MNLQTIIEMVGVIIPNGLIDWGLDTVLLRLILTSIKLQVKMKMQSVKFQIYMKKRNL